MGAGLLLEFSGNKNNEWPCCFRREKLLSRVEEDFNDVHNRIRQGFKDTG